MSKYDDMREFYKKHVDDIKHDRDHWHDRYFNVVFNQKSLETKVEIYEKILNKLLGDSKKITDEIIMFDGKTYKIKEFTMHHAENEPDTLTVECAQIHF